MSDKVMHRAGKVSGWLANQSLPGFTLCGKVLNFNGAPAGSPPCPRCEELAARRGWAPRQG